MKGSLVLSWGKYGGFYFNSDYTVRLCLGWVAITYFPFEVDDLFSGEKDELISAQKEYITFLGDEVSKLSAFALNHNVVTTEETINKGIKFREKIKQLTKQ